MPEEAGITSSPAVGADAPTSRILKDKRIVEDRWRIVRAEDDSAWVEIVGGTDVIVPLELWLAHKDRLARHAGRVGVWLDSHQEPGLLASDLPVLPLIAVNFPQFADGRGYSIGRLLRERYGYRGELRAIGDVLHDQVFYLHRCGFDALAVRADKSIEDALQGFNDFSDGYQASVDQPVPYFRRRLRQISSPSKGEG